MFTAARHRATLIGLFILGVGLSSCTSTLQRRPQTAPSDWYPFVLTVELATDSPANIGKLVLDSPAGKHGFLGRSDDQFEFRNGTPARFWGTTLSNGAPFIDKETARILADRIAFFGFNAVRIASIDGQFAPEGIMLDPSPAYLDPQMKATGEVSHEQLRKLDYLIYLLKQRGIYTTFNLLSQRRFSRADNVIQADKLPPGGGPVAVFDPRLIELQKAYASSLLRHKNPYTGLRYVDDPSIAMVEISQELSLIKAWHDTLLDVKPMTEPDGVIPKFYQRRLDELWNDWLSLKYSTVKRTVVNWDLHTVHGKETGIIFEDPNWRLVLKDEAHAAVKKEAAGSILEIKHPGASAEDIEYIRPRITLEAGGHYLVKFHAQAEQRTPVTVVVIDYIDGFPYEVTRQTVFLEVNPQTFRVPFHVKNASREAEIRIQFGEADENLSFHGLTLKQIDTLPFIADEQYKESFTFHRPLFGYKEFYPPRMIEDMQTFYEELEAEYFDEMVRFLKDEVGVRVPITGQAAHTGLADVRTQADSDYLSVEAAWDAPRQAFDLTGIKMHQRSILSDDSLAYLDELRARTRFDRPVVVQWKTNFPNPYGHEVPLLMAQTALQERWDAVFQNHLSDTLPEEFPSGRIADHEIILENPQQLMLSSAGSMLYLKGRYPRAEFQRGVMKMISPQVEFISGKIRHRHYQLGKLKVTPEENGSIALVSLDGKSLLNSDSMLLIAYNHLRNQGDKWADPYHFKFGKGPVELRNMPLMIAPDFASSPQPKALDPQGIPLPIPSNPDFAPLQLNRHGAQQSPWFWVRTRDN